MYDAGNIFHMSTAHTVCSSGLKLNLISNPAEWKKSKLIIYFTEYINLN